jgi:hypothetical protein
MNELGATYVTVNDFGEARMDFENFQDDEEDGLILAETVSNPVDFNITPASGHIGIVGQAAILEGHGSSSSSATATLTTAPKRVEEPLLAPEEPPDILWSPIARAIMSPRHYKAVWLPNIADMHYERAECLKRGDLRGARWAVLRAHYYSLPRWLLVIPGAFLLAKIRHWLGF